MRNAKSHDFLLSYLIDGLSFIGVLDLNPLYLIRFYETQYFCSAMLLSHLHVGENVIGTMEAARAVLDFLAVSVRKEMTKS